MNFDRINVLQWVTLDTSNLVHRSTIASTIQWMKNYPQGRGHGHMTTFKSFGTPYINMEQVKLETSHLVYG